ncbi:MAG: beta-ketoacyl-ACP synthase II [Gemmatimonas sp.]|jgi:3-oxoacyl-[acyl-carrier-protein] synthase II|uniref:beta-ketoacyl-ACP synthase II n=1 Tax=Gemmatimonas sp. TaxID=1962908 RepID=UPI00391F5816|nr:beta-ketoacyl-ACP synthase II [Gemmatimonadota bacterium]
MNTMRRRVAVTGIGCVTPIGTGVDDMWAGLRAERSAVVPATRFDASIFRSQCAAQIEDFDPTRWIDARRVKRLDRFSQFAVASAHLALEDGALDLALENRERVGAMMGTALGGVGYAEEQAARFLRGGLRDVDATLALAVFGGSASCNIAIEFGVSGPNSTNAMSCASGSMAIGEAFRQIRDGYADVMLAGGSEAPLATLCFGAFALIRAMSTRNDDPSRASRPFDRDRDGFVMGEGAAVLLLESWEHATARGARIYAELAGYGTTNDAHHMTAPLPDGAQAARCMRLALHDAGVEPQQVAYINAHGSSTPLNDPTETLAIKQVFGAHAYRVPLSSTKGYYGHALGASGAFEAAISALAIARGWIPPTLNLDTPDPACDLDYTPRTGRALAPEVVLSNSFGFGGINAALVLRRP